MHTSVGTAQAALPRRLAGTGEIALAPVDRCGRDRVTRWLADPAVAAFCGGRSTAEARIAMALATPSAVCRMLTLDGAAIGYAQAVDAGLVEDAGGPGLAPGTAECFLFVGDAAARGRGHWGAALGLLAEEVLTTTLAIGFAIGVPLRNERVVRAAEHAGFRWQAIHADPALGPCWVMVRARTQT
jgi:hypothetical protein